MDAIRICWFSLLIFTLCHTVNAAYYDYDECNNALLSGSALKATSFMRERGPENAILDGDNAWTASMNDFDQKLIVDLGTIMNITRIWTQGRRHSSEYVMEYSVSYSTNGQDYADFKEPGGNVKMFKGNTDGNTIVRNELEVPIIAQWVRINPTRWRDRISMRVELFGCDYEADILYFNGSSLVSVSLLHDPIDAFRETIKFRMKTSSANGVLLYSRGTQGDYFALQLRDNRMVLNIDLGSGRMTSLSVGSLLDDNIWHDVLISRNRRDIMFSVDRVIVRDKIKGEFTRLNLNRALYIGGVPNMQEGLIVYQNYSGCIENLNLNTTNIIREVKEAYENREYYRYQKINTLYSCPEPPIVPVTFLFDTSYVRMRGYEGIRSMNVSFSFRTYEDHGNLVYHKFLSGGFVRLFLEKGRVKVQLATPTAPIAVLDNYEDTFNDGRWHTVVLTIGTNSLVLSIDNRPMRTVRSLNMQTGVEYIIGAIKSQPEFLGDGFVGCMQMISVDGNYKLPTDWREDEYCCKDTVVFDACHMTDRCNPNPCQHEGSCYQNSKEFFCNCNNTGYGGAVCHTALNPLSCAAYGEGRSVSHRSYVSIDVDGSGPLKPFPVTCEFFADGRVQTVVSHSNEQTTPVDGFQDPGSFVQDIQYEADMDQLEVLLNRSVSCRQRLSYACKESRLMNSPSDDRNYQPFSWWISRNNQRMDYWAGALPGSRKCHCGIVSQCIDPTKWCNCDANSPEWQVDEGDITEKENLPVRQLHFGDTGNPLDDKEGRYTLGALICEGDDLSNNVVTFRIADSTINLPTFDMGHNGDIYFEFKTTTMDAVMFHSKGPSDFIKLTLVGGTQIRFEYSAGSGPLTVSVDGSQSFSDDVWHTVSVERNRKQARIVIDGSYKAEVNEPPGPIRALHLTTDLVVGATVDYRDGYTGCIRSLFLSGQPIDLRGYAQRGIYGISEGCVGKCESNPCLNNGTCFEKYDGYSCDCRWTSFKGPICADEIGINMEPNSMVRYDFQGSWRSTISEHIRVGFTTTNPKGFLLGFFSNITGEYLTLMVSNSGHLRVVFDFGFERQECIFPVKNFGLGQYHDVKLSRKNSGSVLVLEVDNYVPKEFKFDVKASADAQFNNIQYMYIGRNESMKEGFAGCVSRVEFDDIYPLKLMFQEKTPPNIHVIGGPLAEDFCGVEPFTHPPDMVETRPPPIIDEDKLRRAYNQTDSALIGGVLAFIFLLLVLLAFLIGRYVSRHKGEYETQEDAGADAALDPDSAVVLSHTGHQVQKRKEWFI